MIYEVEHNINSLEPELVLLRRLCVCTADINLRSSVISDFVPHEKLAMGKQRSRRCSCIYIDQYEHCECESWASGTGE